MGATLRIVHNVASWTGAPIGGRVTAETHAGIETSTTFRSWTGEGTRFEFFHAAPGFPGGLAADCRYCLVGAVLTLDQREYCWFGCGVDCGNRPGSGGAAHRRREARA